MALLGFVRTEYLTLSEVSKSSILGRTARNQDKCAEVVVALAIKDNLSIGISIGQDET
jgi:hypothetical protein